VTRLRAGCPRNYGSIPDRNKMFLSSEVLDRLRVPPSLLFSVYYTAGRSRDSSVVIATRYGPDGSVIESGWGEILRTRPDRLRGPPSLLRNGYRVFPGGKAAGTWR
jgi:hypothetical protein